LLLRAVEDACLDLLIAAGHNPGAIP